jgi:predicted nucleotidyltransferase component of viral defense system
VIGRAELQRHARLGEVDERTQERDYVLAWVLTGLAPGSFPVVFKGGTCLRHCYFPGYRYSEDLDFSLTVTEPDRPFAEIVAEWCAAAASAAGITLESEPDEERPLKRVFLSYAGPLGASRRRAIKVDLSDEELVLDQIQNRPLLSEYSDLPAGSYSIPAYSLHEIWAEKTRSLMQRSEPRDLFDLDYIAGQDPAIPGEAREFFAQKAHHKGLEPNELEARLAARERVLRARWNDRLGDQLANVPAFDATWRGVKRVFRQNGYFG